MSQPVTVPRITADSPSLLPENPIVARRQPRRAPRPADGVESPARAAAERAVTAPPPASPLAAPGTARPRRAPIAAQSNEVDPVAANPDMMGLRRRSSGEGVAELQRALNRFNAANALDPDGAFGPKVDAAVRAFQEAKGLTPDGIVGRNTLRALGPYIDNSRPRAQDVGDLGPHRVRRVTMQIPVAGGATTTADVYLPDGPGPFVPVIDMYGLTRGRGNHAGTATHFASWGMVVVVPELPHGSGSPGANSEQIQAMTQWLRRQPSLGGKALDTTRGVGLTGHSFGGLTALLAADQPGVGAVVALDPADYWGQGRRAAPGITAPAAFVVGNRSIWNQFGNGHDLYDVVSSRTKQMVKVAGAGHMDFENGDPSGPKNQANRVAMRFATAFLMRHLMGKTEYEAYGPSGSRTRAARQAGAIY